MVFHPRVDVSCLVPAGWSSHQPKPFLPGRGVLSPHFSQTCRSGFKRGVHYGFNMFYPLEIFYIAMEAMAHRNR